MLLELHVPGKMSVKRQKDIEVLSPEAPQHLNECKRKEDAHKEG